MKDELPPLSDLEHELLTILWTHGEMTAMAVRNRVTRKLKDATIRRCSSLDRGWRATSIR